MEPLSNLYTDFTRIDLDTRGGYARVAQVRSRRQMGYPEFYAFKLMRHEIDSKKGLERFEDETCLLSLITKRNDAPSAITRLYDSGFVQSDLSRNLQNRENPKPGLMIEPTGTNIETFRKKKNELAIGEGSEWLPYLVVELAPYDNSLLRQIINQPKEDEAGLFRLPTGEIIVMALQLLDVMDYLHEVHSRAYIDWKPEHIFWDGLNRQVKLIDWNVTTHLDDDTGREQNIKDDLRLFCGAALYNGLTFIDPDNPSSRIGPRPTTDLNSPVPEIRRRYWTDKPDFHQRDSSLDEKIKEIIRQGLDPKQGFDTTQKLRNTLIEYGKNELGMVQEEFSPGASPLSPYFKSLNQLRTAQKQLLNAQQYLMNTVAAHGHNPEFSRLFTAIKRALMNFPIS
jgi:serine/threonine protein kinase